MLRELLPPYADADTPITPFRQRVLRIIIAAFRHCRLITALMPMMTPPPSANDHVTAPPFRFLTCRAMRACYAFDCAAARRCFIVLFFLFFLRRYADIALMPCRRCRQ